jgi:hypothetical protein
MVADLPSYLQQLKLYDIQLAKFPPSPKYAFVSLISIELAYYLKNRIKKGELYKGLSHIGRNAIYYNFCQGVGSSVIYHYVHTIQFDAWLFKWIIIFLINFTITTVTAEILSILYKACYKVVIYIRNYKMVEVT